ncbi:MAG: VWA domain-containing protein [Clostridia bacterium]|nr:VWA domain-containing protein [Clostridia bacterium]
MKKKGIIVFLVIAVVVVAAVFGGLKLTRNLGKNTKTINADSAATKLERYVNDISPIQGTPVKSTVTYSDDDTTFQELPELTDDSIAVRETTSEFAEIFASSEKTGTGTDGFLRDMVTSFNRSGATVNGTPVSVRLRTVSSGQQVDYVASGKYVPDAISPSSSLSVKMLNSKGVATSYAAQSLVKNYAGIVLTKTTYSTLTESYGDASVMSLAQATADDKIIMGYTNPFTSATGMNFLVTLLDSYSPGNIGSEKAVNGFTAFQANVPFVAMTTTQMRTAAERGTFDAFVLEYQYYMNDATLSKNYQFIPFGYIHDNPLAVIDSTDDVAKQILTQFAEYCEANGAELAKKDGFNTAPNGFTEMLNEYTGEELISAQKLYKENKDSKPIVCVFVADVSGSMVGEPINALKDSLINSMQYINTDNYIGFVSYSDIVTIELPIAQFDLTQQSLFKGTIESLQTNGTTATFDAVCVAMKMVQDKLAEVPEAKPMIFVLSDGETNEGHSLSDISDIISGLKIPIYTIGYNADIDALAQLSDINEGICINAGTDDITYQLKQLFNANM